MKRIALMMAMFVSVFAGPTRAAQDPVKLDPASPVQGGKTSKSKTMTAEGAVKTITADSLAINDGPGKDWTFVIDAKTKILPKAGQETVEVTPASPVKGGKVLPSKALTVTDIKEGQRVQVSYHDVKGKMHATQVRLM